MRNLHDALADRQLLAGATEEATLAGLVRNQRRDLLGGEGPYSLLHLTQPRALRAAYRTVLEAGADIVVTATATAHPLALVRPDLRDSAFYLNYTAAELACQAIDSLPGGDRRRFVGGLIADGGWLARPADLEAASSVQAQGLIAGGVDGLFLRVSETAARAGALLAGVRAAARELKSSIPLILLGEATALGSLADAADDVLVPAPAEIAGTTEPESAVLWWSTLAASLRAADTALRGRAPDGLRPLQPGGGAPWMRDEFVTASSCLDIESGVPEQPAPPTDSQTRPTITVVSGGKSAAVSRLSRRATY